MKAARYYGPGNVQLDQVPEPEAKEGQVKIKVHHMITHRSTMNMLMLTPDPDCLVCCSKWTNISFCITASFLPLGTAVGSL